MKYPEEQKRKPNKLIFIIGVILFIYLISFGASKLIIPQQSDKIAIIPIEGELVTAGESSIPFKGSSTTSSQIVAFIESANKDQSIKGILLQINSPGGTVIASKEIADAVKSSPKPVVAWIREIGTSGAYWVASASDAIVADELSIVGSIGVTSSYLQFAGLMKQYGVGYEQLTTGKYKDLGSPFRELTADERAEMQKRLMVIHQAFVDEVANNRHLDPKKVADLANGIFYLGKEAKEDGLVDYLGGKELAINITKEKAHITEAKLVTFKEQKSILSLLQRLETDAFYEIGVGIGSVIIAKTEQEQVTPKV